MSGQNEQGYTVAAILLIAVVPFAFLHIDYQPGIDFGLGSTTATLRWSDFVVGAATIAAIVAAHDRLGDVWRAARPLWVALAAFAAVVVLWSVVPAALGSGAIGARHVVTAVKFVEYMTLAVAVALVVRRPRDAAWLPVPLVVWSALASAVGLAQFVGVEIFEWGEAGWRQGSFLGQSDFAALSGAALLTAVAALATGPPDARLRWLTPVAAASGIVGLVIAGAGAGAVGAAAATAVVLAVVPRRGHGTRARAVAAGLAVVAVVGVLGMRSRDIGQFARFVGIAQEPAGREEDDDVQTYAHRTVLSYIGLRIFLDDPLVGVGWQGSAEPQNFEPQLAAARARFPDQPALVFPSERRRYGVQNAYVQALADLGIAGTAVAVALFAIALALAFGAARAAAPAAAWTGALALGWLVLVLGLWAAQGLVAGIPLAALTWIAVGTAATAAVLRRPVDA